MLDRDSFGCAGIGRPRETLAARLLGWAAVGAVASQLTGCPLPVPELDLEGFPSDDPILECVVTVRNPQAQAEFGVDAVPEQTLSSRGGIFLNADGTALRPYYLGGECIIGASSEDELWGFASLAEAEDDWARFAQQRINSEASDPESQSILSFFEGTWCAVPDSLVCRRTDEPIVECVSRPPLSSEPLPTCVLPPPQDDACLEIDCGDGSGCTFIDFGDQPVGDQISRSVAVTNCGGPNAPPVRVTLDGAVTPVGVRSDFAVPIANNSCHPTNGDNASLELPLGGNCGFQVQFNPGTAGEHRGQTAFTSSAQSGAHRIDLFGNALGGSLALSAPDLPDPSQIPEPFCVDALVDQCTAPGTIDISNPGPGLITVSSIGLEQNQGFELVDGAQTPLALSAGDSSTVQFHWCGPVLSAGEATLVIDSDDPAQPTFALPLIRRPAGCDPDPSLVAAYSFEGTGTEVVDITGSGFDGTLQGPAQRDPAGRFGASLRFDGTDGHVDLGTDLVLSGDQFTIAMWINADDFDVNQARFIARAVGRNEQQQYWQVGTAGPNGNRLRFRVRTAQGDTTTLESAPILQAGEWTHVAVTYDGAQMSIFQDGVLIASTAKAGDIVVDPGVDVWIGDSPPNGTRSFDGRLDELRIYNQALEPQEIQQISELALTPVPGAP